MNNKLITSCLDNRHYMASLDKRSVSDNFPQEDISSLPFFSKQNNFFNGTMKNFMP